MEGGPVKPDMREDVLYDVFCQIIFFQGDEVCEVSYADRKGKYQSQKGIVLPKL